MQRVQFADRGESYKPAIFYHDDEQKQLAEQSKQKMEESNKFDQPIVVEIRPAETFYEAEEEHQDYYKKNSFHYQLYKKDQEESNLLKTLGKTKIKRTFAIV